MDEGRQFELVDEPLVGEQGDDLGRVWVLTRAGKEDFLSAMRGDKQGRHDALLISYGAHRMMNIPCDMATRVQLLRPLSDSDGIYAFELRPNPRKSVMRVMVYLHHHETALAVLLFAFEGHRGSRKGIEKKYLDKAKKLAGEARTLMEQDVEAL